MLCFAMTVAFTMPGTALAAERTDSPLPSLAQVIELAKARAPDVVAAKGRLGVAQASYEGANLPLLGNPYMELYVDRGTSSTKDVALAGSLWLPIDVSGQRSRRIAEVDALVAWDATNLLGVRGMAAGDTVAAYGDVVVGGERVRAYESIAATSRAEAAVYNARLGAGDASLQDAKFAEVELSKNLLSLAESKAELTRSVAVLARMTGAEWYGIPSGTAFEPPASTHGTEHAALAEQGAAKAPSVVAGQREAEFYDRSRERQAREAHTPVSVILTGGRGDVGDARFGAGLAWAFPIVRTNQGEQARAAAESARALSSRDAQRHALTVLLRALYEERVLVRAAIAEVTASGQPAAQQAVDAAVAMARAGKSELLRVLFARRDLAMLLGRKLDLIRREWSIVGHIVAITGELP